MTTEETINSLKNFSLRIFKYRSGLPNSRRVFEIEYVDGACPRFVLHGTGIKSKVITEAAVKTIVENCITDNCIIN